MGRECVDFLKINLPCKRFDLRSDPNHVLRQLDATIDRFVDRIRLSFSLHH